MLYNLFAIDQQRVIASDLLLFSFPSKDDQRLAWIVWWWSFMFGKVTGHGRLTVEENLWSMAIRYFWVWLSARSCYALTVVVDSETVNVRRVTYILYYMLPRTTLRAFREFNTFQLWVISIQCSDILCSRAGCHVKSLWEVVSAQKLGQFWSWERLSASFLLHKLLFVLFANLAVSKYISLLTYQSISEFRNPPFSLSLSVCCRALNPHNNIPPPTYLSNHWPTLVAHKVSACQWKCKLCSYKNSWMGGLAVTFHWDTFLRQHHHHHGTSHKDWTGERV